MRWKESFHPYAMVTVFFWSMANVLTRLATQYFSAFSLGFLRYLVASVALVAVVFMTKMKAPMRKDWPWFAVAGAVGFFFYMIAYNQGCAATTAATTSVVIATTPVITALIARIIYREKLRALQWAGIVVEFLGVVVLTLMNGVFSINGGLQWLFGATLLLSTYNLLQRRLTQTYTALQTSAFSIFAGTVMLSVFAPRAAEDLKTAPPIQLLYITLLGVFCSAVAYVSWSKAFSKAEKTSSVSNYMFVTPFLTSILGFVMVREVPDLATLVGGGVILAGVMIFNFGEKICTSFSRGREQEVS